MKTRGHTVKVGESGFLFAVEQELSILCRHILGWFCFYWVGVVCLSQIM